jgi:hypothetical protein
MKTGRSLADLAAEIDRQRATKHDYLADTRKIKVVADFNAPPRGTQKDPVPDLVMQLEDTGQFPIRDNTHGQIAAHTGIPKQYYDRMRDTAPELLANNIETWFRKYPADRMVRTLDHHARAFLSNSFRPLDHYDFANVILEAAMNRKLEVMSCEITERRLYIKAVDTSEVKVPVGYKMGDGSHRIFDVCAPAFIASNSETGDGRLVLETGIYTRACTNLAWFSAGGMKRTHLGSRHKIHEMTGVENIDHLLTDKTRQKSDEALWMQLRDVLGAAFDPKRIEQRAESLTVASENKITGNPAKVMELVTDRFGLSEGESGSVLRHLIEGGSLSQYGLHAAITRSAQDHADYDRATELEYLGGKIIELPRAEWQTLAEAA